MSNQTSEDREALAAIIGANRRKSRRETADAILAAGFARHAPRADTAEDDFGDASIGRAMAAWRESGEPEPENKSRLGGSL